MCSFPADNALSLPKGWEVKKLGDVCEIFAGGDVPKNNLSKLKTAKYNIPIFSNGVKNDGLYGYTDIAKVIEASITVSARGTIGYSSIRKESFYPVVRLIVLTPKNNLLNLNFLWHVTKSIDFTNTGSSIPQLTVPMIKKHQIPLPPLPEQKRIVAILDQAFTAIAKAKANTEQNLKNAREIFQSALQTEFANGKLKIENGEWEEKRLGEVYDVRDGTHDSPKYQEEGFALITSKNLKNNSLDYTKIKYISEQDYMKINKRSKVNKGDILFAMIGTIGNPVVIQFEPNFAIKNVALFKVPKGQNSHFLKFYLDTKMTIDKMMRDAKGATQKFVGLGYLRNYKIKLPSLKEQEVIAKKLNILSTETKKLETIYQQKINDLDELKKSMLQKAFNGEL